MKNDQGFTLIELLITMIMTGLFVSILMFFAFSYWKYGYTLDADLSTFVDRLNAGDIIREQVGTSSNLMTQNSIPDPNTHYPDPAFGSNTIWYPLHAVPGNTAMPAAGSYRPVLYYSRFSVNTSGNFIYNNTQPYEDQYVLYLDGSAKALKVRALANTSATGNRLKRSCPAALATTSCPADRIIIKDVSSVDIRYFSRNGIPIDFTSITDPITGNYAGPDYSAAEVFELTLNVKLKPIFQKSNTTQNSNVIRIALRNT